MRVIAHVVLSLLVSFLLNELLGLMPALCAFLAGVLIDLDHVIDFFLWSKDRSLRSLLVFGSFLCKPHPTDFFLHSYELLVPMWVLIWTTNAFLIGLGLTIGFVIHLTTDQVTNYLRFGVNPLTCFLTYKMWKQKDRLEEFEKRMAVRKMVLKRDGYKCRICGAPAKSEIHDNKPHHGCAEDSLDHYIAICRSCHTKKHVFFWKLLQHLEHTE